MKVLISERLSEHKYKTPEGYLICTDAILARTGKQRYTKDELFGNGDSEEVDVDRPYEQVMNEKTISSFENKPVTFDHPDEDVNVGNYKEYAVGYVRDVHQGKVDGRDVILGNLVITDQDAIDAIENGEHTDLSCGYDCDIKDDGHGSYYQNNIRGNHVALCREGRAGNARIIDSKVKDISWSWDDLETFIYKNYKDGPVHSEVDEDVLDGFNNRLDATKLADFLEKRAHVDRADIVRTRFGYGIKVYGVHDSKLNDAFNNGKLKDFRIEDLIRLVKERKEAVNSIRLDDKGNIYYIFVDGSLDTDLNTGKNASLDVVCEDKESHRQKRCIMLSRASSWKEIISTFNRWRDTIRDSIDDSIYDSLSASEKDLCDYMLENCREEDEDENDLLKKMKLYYSEYSSLARNKPNEVLKYFREHIDNFEDSIKDSSKLSASKALKMIGIVSMLRKK